MTLYAVHTTQASPLETVRTVLADLLTKEIVDAVLVAAPTPYSQLPMPILFTDHERLAVADPLAPVAPFNMARQAVKVLKHTTGQRVALVLRPCELRALVELVKLNQAVLDEALLIGLDCDGRLENEDFLALREEERELPPYLLDDPDLAGKLPVTCRTCDQPVPVNVDLTVCRHGLKKGAIGFLAHSESGEAALNALDFTPTSLPQEREAAIAQLTETRSAAKETLMEATRAQLSPIETFQQTVANCINCYNCRNVCPVCYCKECVFLTDVFLHQPEVFLARAHKQGALKIPTDTTMFHMTRLTHIAHACVGCGQCSSVCPSRIPVADIFRTVAATVQKEYGYQPGADLNQKIPYLAYKEKD